MGLREAQRGELPAVCVVSGRQASGFCPIAVRRGPFRSTTVRLPMSERVFGHWLRRSLLQVRSGLGMGLSALGAVVTYRFPTIALVFVLLTAAFAGPWFFATWTLPSVTPAAAVDGRRLVLSDAHPAFAAAIAP